MSKNQSSGSPGSGTGSTRGDVSFIRATHAGPNSTNIATSHQNVEISPTQHLNQNSSHPPRMTQDLSLQPHIYHQQQHHHQPRQQSQQQRQQMQHLQQYLPEHMEGQHYLMKQPHGAGGASGDPVGRIPSHTGVEGWSEREEALAAELEEAKIRVAQMEKTMRWWSDCTSNWREKWNKARNERNKAREENRILRTKLEAVHKELSRLKRERKETCVEKERIGEENETSHSSTNSKSQESLELSEKEKTVLAGANEKECESLDDVSETSSSVSKPVKDQHDEKDMDDTEISAVHDGSVSGESTATIAEMSDRISHLQIKQAALEEDLAQALWKATQAGENVVEMQRKLDEANNTIQAERLDKCNQKTVVERLERELKETQSKLEEGVHSRQELKTQLEKTQQQHQEELARLTLDLEDETVSRTTMDKRVTELRRELERIQAENASEWAKRERLESDKLALERDNKKLRTQLADLEEELEKRSQATSSLADSDIKTLQFELSEKNKELADVKHVHGKLKKALTERTTELEHNRRRAEQYETEVRKLRGRVDELKHDLAAAEDEVDKQGNAARKAQRTSDELQTQLESLQVQVNHLQSRLRTNSKHGGLSTPRSTSLKSLTLEDSAELADSENDFDDI